jgi:hypothetical protein
MPVIAEVETARNEAERIRPFRIIAYPDYVKLWLPIPLPRFDIRRLRTQCGGDVDDDTPPHGMKIGGRIYRQRLKLFRPSREALRSLADRDGVMNRLELALDWVFDSPQPRDAAYLFECRYHVKQWHGKQKITFIQRTRYTAKPTARNNFIIYPDLECRITREPFCVHNEARMKGAPTLHRAGLATIHALLNLDMRRFWERWLMLRVVDYRTLGLDTTTAAQLVQQCGGTQQFIDTYRTSIQIGLVPIEVPHLLPPNGAPIHYTDVCNQTSRLSQFKPPTKLVLPTETGNTITARRTNINVAHANDINTPRHNPLTTTTTPHRRRA